MSKELQDLENQSLVKLINLATDGVNGAIEFSKQQIPDVIHQLLLWNLVQSLIIFILGIVIVIIPLALDLSIMKALLKEDIESFWVDRDKSLSMAGFGVLLFGLFPLVMGSFICVSNVDWLQIWLAPKVYLIQYAATLLK